MEVCAITITYKSLGLKRLPSVVYTRDDSKQPVVRLLTIFFTTCCQIRNRLLALILLCFQNAHIFCSDATLCHSAIKN